MCESIPILFPFPFSPYTVGLPGASRRGLAAHLTSVLSTFLIYLKQAMSPNTCSRPSLWNPSPYLHPLSWGLHLFLIEELSRDLPDPSVQHNSMFYYDFKMPSSSLKSEEGRIQKVGTRKSIFPLMKKISPKMTLFQC